MAIYQTRAGLETAVWLSYGTGMQASVRRAAFVALLLLAACRIESAAPNLRKATLDHGHPAGEIWVYTSAYPAIVEQLNELARRKLPDVKIRWFKAGTEKISSRIEGELAAGGAKADVLMVSDPFLYERYKRQGLLLRYASPNELRIPRSLLDLDGYYTTVRISTMVLAYRSSLGQQAPRSFLELTKPKWKNQVAIGDPLASGTAFTWSAFMLRTHGGGFFQALRKNGVIVAGGNAAVQTRLESGEVQVGVLLLENLLLAGQKGSDLTYRYPSDGAVTIPGYVAIFNTTHNPAAAKAFYDLMLTREAQDAMVQTGMMHSPVPDEPGPQGQPGVDWLLGHSIPWSGTILEWGQANSADIKRTFAEAFSR